VSATSGAPTTVSTTTSRTALNYLWVIGGNNVLAEALLQFSGSGPVLARFRVSRRSLAQACANVDARVPIWDFAGVQNA
jgi:hypothetical protein